MLPGLGSANTIANDRGRERHTSRFICKNNKLSYKDRLFSFKRNLIPLNYWLEYLKCKLWYINKCVDRYVSIYTGCSHCSASGLFLKVNAKISLFRNSFFVRNALPPDLMSESNIKVEIILLFQVTSSFRS